MAQIAVYMLLFPACHIDFSPLGLPGRCLDHHTYAQKEWEVQTKLNIFQRWLFRFICSLHMHIASMLRLCMELGHACAA